VLIGNGVHLKLHYTPDTLQRFLTRVALPVGPLGRDEIGAGFISRNILTAALRNMRMTDLLAIFADPDDPRRAEWQVAIEAAGNPMVFSLQDVGQFSEYCNNYDLVLARPINGAER